MKGLGHLLALNLPCAGVWLLPAIVNPKLPKDAQIAVEESVVGPLSTFNGPRFRGIGLTFFFF